MSFPTTRWSVVLGAKPSEPASGEALRALCAAYWRPLYAFLRRQGLSKEDAEDAVQGFLASLLAGSGIGGADQERGRFRSYLLGALRNYLSNERAKAQALKRGGSRTPLSIDAEEGEALQIPDLETPEQAYAYAWAMEILDRTRARLAERYAAQGKAELFAALEPYLGGDAPPYKQVASALGISEAHARVNTHRLRTAFGKALREEVAQTVADEADVDDELRAVIAATALR